MTSRGLLRDGFFNPTLTRIMDSFSCSPLFSFIYLFQNKLPDVPQYARIQFHIMKLLDILGKIAWISYIFYSRVKSQISILGVQEKYI